MIFSLIMGLFLTTLSGAENIRFAVIGDYGSEGNALRSVAEQIDSWQVDFIITTGDNNYPDGTASTIDANIGQYFHDYIAPYKGNYGSGADSNRFFPCLGNHDWRAENAQPYLDYFELPGNERYYDFVRGPVHFFVIDSDSHEPDGTSAQSVQAQWLKEQLAMSISPWNVVYMHHPPYSSSKHGSNEALQWPFKEWGASVVLAGHDHSYERLMRDSLLYIVNGLGGRSIYDFNTPVEGSQFRYNDDYGAMLVTATADSMTFAFFNSSDEEIDRYALHKAVTAVPNDNQANDDTDFSFELLNNYPNPFNDVTNIPFNIRMDVRENDQIWIKIYNLAGMELYTYKFPIIPFSHISGTLSLEWHNNGLPSGMYIYTVSVRGHTQSGKMILIK